MLAGAIRPRRETAQRMPFLFDAEQARGLLDAARHLPDGSRAPLRGLTYRTMFALLYGLGLRVGEVVAFVAATWTSIGSCWSFATPSFPRVAWFRLDRASDNCWPIISRGATVRRGPCSPEALLFSFDGSKAISLTAIAGTLHRLLR